MSRKRIEPNEPQLRRQVMLSERYIEIARDMGDGNVSAGLRRALDLADMEDDWDDELFANENHSFL